MCYFISPHDERQKMTENIDPRIDPQLRALMQVMNEITNNRVPFYEPHELAARSTLRALQHEIDDRNALDDGELIDVLNQARIEVKYLLSIVSDLLERVKQRDIEIGIQQLRLNENEVEIQRLEHMVHRAN
jgi:predicted RNA-binding protein with EMAP domain